MDQKEERIIVEQLDRLKRTMKENLSKDITLEEYGKVQGRVAISGLVKISELIPKYRWR